MVLEEENIIFFEIKKSYFKSQDSQHMKRRILWDSVTSLIGISWVMSGSNSSEFLVWDGIWVNKNQKKLSFKKKKKRKKEQKEADCPLPQIFFAIRTHRRVFDGLVSNFYRIRDR